MSKVAVVYWSGTGNTAQMADFVADGARSAGCDVDVFSCDAFSADKVNDYDALAFGCPSMGSEQLEDTEFEPLFDDCKASLKTKKVALFGSYGWGDGEWMRNWQDDCASYGITLVADGVICNETPDDSAADECRALGAALA